MLLCDHILFWAQHRRQPVFYGNLSAYVQFKAVHPNREPSYGLMKFKKRLKAMRRG